ncbi:MAG: hypothetical protein ACW963_06450, partial [Candidatus Sifarchaeia archaeon]
NLVHLLLSVFFHLTHLPIYYRVAIWFSIPKCFALVRYCSLSHNSPSLPTSVDTYLWVTFTVTGDPL